MDEFDFVAPAGPMVGGNTCRVGVDGTPIQNAFRSHTDIPASTALSDTISKDMKKRGFKFFGTTICYAHMQATGMVNDHVIDCYRYSQC